MVMAALEDAVVDEVAAVAMAAMEYVVLIKR